MPIKFILDTREKHLQRFFDNNSIPYETRQLDLGDILVLYSKGEIQERKIERLRSQATGELERR